MKNYISVTHDGDLAKEYLNVNWCLTSICNFSCTYCPERLHDGKVRGPKPAQVIEMINKIADNYPTKKMFFEFTGGEVTYYKNFLDIAKHVKSRGSDAGIISNGKRELSFWQQLRPFLDHICLSYHPENQYANHFTEVVRYLNQTVTVHVNVMMEPSLFDDCIHIANQIYGTPGVSLCLQPLFKDMRKEKFKYTSTQLDILEKQLGALTPAVENNPNTIPPQKKHRVYRGAMRFKTAEGEEDVYGSPEMMAHNLNNWNGWYCYAGLENLTIDPAGHVRRSWCAAPNTYLGNLETGVRLPTAPVLCKVSKCHCGFDMMCTKVKAPPSSEPAHLRGA